MKDAGNILYVATSCRWFCALGCLLIGSGCGGKSNGDMTPVAEQREVKLADGTTAVVVRDDGQPVSLTLSDGRSISLADGEAVVDEQFIFRSPTGRVEVHRLPNKVVDEMDQLPHLYLKEGSLEEFVTEGFRGEPHVGPDGALYWSARVCKNPDCAGASAANGERPQLFINRLPGFKIDASGKLVSGDQMPSALINPCPLCGSAEFIRQYVLPDTAARQAELADELIRVRAARRAAKRSN